jgi:hypothetical protein
MRVEAQGSSSRFRHPHIPHCFDCGYTLDGRPYTVLEFSARRQRSKTILGRIGRFAENRRRRAWHRAPPRHSMRRTLAASSIVT